MSTVIENIERIETAKVNIKTAIVDKGVAVPETATLDAYPDLIGQIQGGGGGGITAEIMRDLNFNNAQFSSLPAMFQNADWSLKNTMSNTFAQCVNLTSISLPEMPEVTSIGGCFKQCSNLKSISLPSDLSKVKSMNAAFYYCTSLTSISLPDGMTEITDMENCFGYCSVLSKIDGITELPNVTTLSNAFTGCGRLSSITLPELPQVTSMSRTFTGDGNLTYLSISSLPIASNLSWIFYGCGKLNTLILPDLPQLKTTNFIFYGCTSLENLTIGKINSALSNITNWAMADYCTKLTVDSLVNVLNALPTRTGTNKCTIGTANLNKLSEEQKAIATNKGWTLN